MSNQIDLQGNVNDIYFTNPDSIKYVNKGLSIYNHGSGNQIVINENVIFDSFNIRVNCNNSKIYIGSGCELTGTVIMKLTDNNQLNIGENTSVGGANFICGEGKSITIGKDCMIAWGIEFRNTDSHAIFDLDTKQRINQADDIIIGNHVWIGAHSTILKGSNIKNGSIIAIKSLVSSYFENENIIIGGIPAKELKRNIYWERPLLG